MKFEYFPNEIAEALAKLAGETDPEIIGNAGGALYDLKAICENPYNMKYYRDLYRLLERVAAAVEG